MSEKEKEEVTFSEEFLTNLKEQVPEKHHEKIIKFIKSQFEDFDPDNIKEGGLTLEHAIALGLVKKEDK